MVHHRNYRLEPGRGDNSHMTSSTADVERSIISQRIQCSRMVFWVTPFWSCRVLPRLKMLNVSVSMQSDGTCQPLQSETASVLARNCLIFRDVNCKRHRGKSQESKTRRREQMEFQQEKKGFYTLEKRIDTTAQEVSKRCISTAGVPGKYWGQERYRNLLSGWLCRLCEAGPLDNISSHPGEPANAKTKMCNIIREVISPSSLKMCSYGFSNTFPSSDLSLQAVSVYTSAW